MGAMLIALPFVATAAASAHKFMAENAAIEAPASTEAISSVIGVQRIHNVTLNRNGAIEGRIASLTQGVEGISNLKVFLVRDGEIAQETLTDENGTFELANVAEGAYSFVATGENGFAAYGVNVVANDGSQSVNVMEAAAVSPRFEAVQKILQGNLPTQVTSEILANSSTNAEKVVGSNRVQIKNGKLVGHVVPLLGEVDQVKGTYVHIIQDDKAVAEVQADENGYFQVSDLEPGVYDFVAAGPTGFAAVSFEAIAQDAVAEIGDSVVVDSEEVPVSIAAEPMAEPSFAEPAPIYQDMISTDIPFDGGMGYSDMGAPAQSLDVCMTCQGDAGFVGDQIDYAGTDVYADQGIVYDSAPIEYASESVGMGGACGGSCGGVSDFSGYSSCNMPSTSCGCSCNRGLFGGGLLNGGGGLRRLALLGGIAGAIVAIADDDDGPEASPSGN